MRVEDSCILWYFIGCGGLWGVEGLDCGIGVERLGFWGVLFFVFVVMVWVLSGMVGGVGLGYWGVGIEGVEGLRAFSFFYSIRDDIVDI